MPLALLHNNKKVNLQQQPSINSKKFRSRISDNNNFSTFPPPIFRNKEIYQRALKKHKISPSLSTLQKQHHIPKSNTSTYHILRTKLSHIKNPYSNNLPVTTTSKNIPTQPSTSIQLHHHNKKSPTIKIDTLPQIPPQLSSTLHNYYGKYPSSSQLTLHKFGRPSKSHSFTSDVVFEHTLIFIFKSKFLSKNDTTNIQKIHPLFTHLYNMLTNLREYDFRPLSSPDPTYSTRTTIPNTRKLQFMAATLHYNFHIASVIRYCGHNYTNSHIQIPQLISKIKHIIPKSLLQYITRALTIGAPSFINAHNPRSNFLDYYTYGNHSTIQQNPQLVAKALVKEDRYNFFIPLPSWMCRFLYNMHLSPEGLVIKPGKTDRLVFDATFQIYPHSLSLNTSWTHVHDEPPIWYGTAFQRHLTRIWNLRISFPLEDILLWDDDVSGAFRLIKYNPEIAAAFAAILNNTLCIPVGQNFGGNTSAQNWEGIAKAREILAQYLSNTKFQSLIEKHHNILSLIKYSKKSNSKTKFIPAAADTLHKGVFNQQGEPRNTPHNTFVDDNTIAETRRRMPQAMAASVESLFILLGFPDPAIRRSPLSMDKYYQAQCSYSKKQLGYLINTRTMMITFPSDKLLKMTNILHKWHSKRKSYTIRQAAELAGNLEFFASTAIWIRFLTYSIKNSILIALRANTTTISSTKSMRTWLQDTTLPDLNNTSTVRKYFAFSKIMKAVWNTKTKFFITIPLRNELKYLHKIFSSPIYKIQSPIAHVIPRDPDYIAYGDACLDGAGGFSTKLKFWWFIPWPDAIKNRNIKNFNTKYKSITGEILSINLLEYIAILISYAASIALLNTHQISPSHPYPTIKIFSDNKSALAWTTKSSTSSSAGKSLSLILASLLVNEPMGLWSTYVEGEKNIIADRISRMQTHSKKITFTSLSQVYPDLQLCRRFHPSPEFLSLLWGAMLSPRTFTLLRIKNLGQFSPVSNIG